MKKLVIIGAGDFGREVAWMVERINAVSQEWDLIGFVDDNLEIQNTKIGGYPFIGGIDSLCSINEDIYTVCSVGTGVTRKKIMDKLTGISNVHLATLIDPAAIIGRNVKIEEGCIICAGTIITVDCWIKSNVIINLNCTVGHDAVIDDFCTVQPGCNLSGRIHINSCVDVGTGSKIIQGKTICSNVVLGAGAVVVRDITIPGTYVGVPVKMVNK